MDVRLPASYAEGVDRFAASAAAAGAIRERVEHPGCGPAGEALSLDVARLGEARAETVLVVMSGTHGVEGFAGSGCQTAWLATGGAAAAVGDDLAVLLVHALNPFGFAWVRRVNEDNVDLNRNFVDFGTGLPDNAAYDELADALVPEDWSIETQRETTDRILAYAGRHGFPALQAAISGGQYRHATGLFFGGTGPSWSHLALRGVVGRHLTDAQRVVVVDLHTGLGPFGVGELLGPRPATEEWRRARDWFGEITTPGEADSVSAAVSGDVLDAIGRWLPGTEYTPLAIEWGTVDIVEVLQALRADAWLHAHGDPRGREATPIKAALRAAFAPDNPEWVHAVGKRFEEVVGQAVAGLTA